METIGIGIKNHKITLNEYLYFSIGTVASRGTLAAITPDSTMTIEEMFHDYKLICKMKSPLKIKAGMLTQLFRTDENRWRVVGITEDALRIFKNNGFKKAVRMGINRSHKHERIKVYTQMLKTTFETPQKWWEYYQKHDETILATSSENNSENYSNIYYFNHEEQLFKSKGFSWRHTKSEKDFLQQLHNKHFLEKQ